MADKGKVLETVVSLAGNVDPSLSKSINDVQKKFKGINVKAIAAGAAMAGVAVATGKAVASAGKYLEQLGESFDSATDAIRIGTGATGDALNDLLDDFDAVYKSIPTTMEEASQAIADYNTRLGLTGEELQGLSTQAIQVSDMLGEDLGKVIEESSQAFQQWNIGADDMGNAMDYIFKVSQSTGMGFNDLMANMQSFGPQLQEMGYSFEEASALMGQLDKAGVNTSEVLAAMKKSVTTLAKEGLSAQEGLAKYHEQIKNAGTAAEAAAIAADVFGTRAGSTMAAAIRDGTLSAADLTASLAESGETIAGAADDTYDFAERLQMMRQGLEVALKPLANTVFDGINKFMPTLQKMLEKITPAIASAVDVAVPLVEEFFVGGADALAEIIPLISDFAGKFMPIITTLVGSLLPPLVSMANQLLPPLMQIMETILPPISDILIMILPIITQIVNAVLPVLVSLLSALLPILEPILNTLSSIAQAVLPPIMSLLNAVMPLIQKLSGFLSPVASLLGDIAGFIGKIAGTGANVIGKLFSGGASIVSKIGGVLGFATGGFTNGLSIAGEDPNYPNEAVISFNPAYRSQNLGYWAKAGRMLGAKADDFALSGGSGGSSINFGDVTFSPVINAGGAADSNDIIKAIKAEYPEFLDMLEKWASERGEFRYA